MKKALHLPLPLIPVQLAQLRHRAGRFAAFWCMFPNCLNALILTALMCAMLLEPVACKAMTEHMTRMTKSAYPGARGVPPSPDP